MTVREARYALARRKLMLKQRSKHDDASPTIYELRPMEKGYGTIVKISLEQIEAATDITQLLPVEVQRADQA